MPAAYLVASLQKFRQEANERYPNRDKSSDGWIGDAAHSGRISDHNPDAKGAVHAYDLDEDLDGNQSDSGAELSFLAEHIRLSRDPRVKYVIYERRIFSGNQGPSPWVWRPYSGANAHGKHMHVSVLSTSIGENNVDTWFPSIQVIGGEFVAVPLPVLGMGSTGGPVKSLQSLLVTKAAQTIDIDGAFGPNTGNAVMNVQRFFGLPPSGYTDEKTWGVLFL